MANGATVKVILLGDSGVGKTSLINRFVHGKFQQKSTFDFPTPLYQDIQVNIKHVTLQIRDTCGRERQVHGLEAAFFNGAKACMLVYDVTEPKSVENLENWHNVFSNKVQLNPPISRGFPFIVLGNKSDIDNGKEVNSKRAQTWCQERGIKHLFTSAKNNTNVLQAFEYVAELAIGDEMQPNSNVEGKRKDQSPNTNFKPNSTYSSTANFSATYPSNVPSLPSKKSWCFCF